MCGGVGSGGTSGTGALPTDRRRLIEPASSEKVRGTAGVPTLILLASLTGDEVEFLLLATSAAASDSRLGRGAPTMLRRRTDALTGEGPPTTNCAELRRECIEFRGDARWMGANAADFGRETGWDGFWLSGRAEMWTTGGNAHT